MTQSNPNISSGTGLDAVDQEIIGLLRIDGRMPFTEIAKRLSIPEATARYRVQRLLQSGIIQILAWPNPEKLGTPHLLIIYMIVENGYINTVAEAMAKMEEVRFVAITAGRYNLIVDVFFGVHEELIAFFDKLQNIQGIITYDSQMTLKLLKAEYKYTLA
jgi:Lrp/AsnC family transcriptional regulator for asnA, asnC and gidA